MESLLRGNTLRVGHLVLPMKYVQAVLEPLPGKTIMTPTIDASDDTVLVVRIPGKQAEKELLEWISEKQFEMQRLPVIPAISPPPTTSTGYSSPQPLLLFDAEQ